jgi:gliding motility-associated-like protein
MLKLVLSKEFLDDDCDGDGINNEEEIGSNPNQPHDFNANGIADYLELNNQSKSEDNVEIFKSLTPNGNGENDVFVIRNINLYPNNTVTVFNRWGVVVYEENGYGSNEKFFRGYSDGKCTMKKGVELPNGTYFYQVQYTNNEGKKKSRTGYLFINK